jgi:hypothetical protein
VRGCLLDKAARRLVAVVVHAVELAADETGAEIAADETEGKLVLDFVTEERPAAAIVNHVMAMEPVSEGAGSLTVGEEMGRGVLGVDGDPLDGNGADLSAENDAAADGERTGGLDDAHRFPRRDELRERGGAFMEGENRGGRGVDS